MTMTLTDELAEALADAVSQGVPIETACAASGISPRSFHNWIRSAETGMWDSQHALSEEAKVSVVAFADRIARATAQWEATRVQNIVKAASAVNAKTGLKDWRAEAWLLNNHPRTRERYRQHKELQIDSVSTVTHEHRLVAGLSLEQLDALEQDVKALPSPLTD